MIIDINICKKCQHIRFSGNSTTIHCALSFDMNNSEFTIYECLGSVSPKYGFIPERLFKFPNSCPYNLEQLMYSENLKQ